MVIKGFRVGPLLKKTGQEILDDNVMGLSAQMAYFFFFSLFPLLLFLAPLIGMIGDKQRILGTVMNQLSRTVPSDAMALMRGIIEDVVYAPGAPGLMSVGAVFALWAGSNVFNNLINALNRAYDVEEGRSWWKKRLIAIAAVIASGIVIFSATTVMLAGEQIIGWMAGAVGLDESGETAWKIAQYPLVLLLLTGLAFLIYWFLPAIRGQQASHVLTGGAIATVLWVAVTLGFRFYVQNFGNYNKTYGTIGAVIVILLWMYLSMLVVLSVGELLSEMHNGTGHVRGRAGATFQGRLSTGGEPRTSDERITRVEVPASD